MGGYSFITFGQLESALLQRLQDVAGSLTSPAEAQIYIQEALRVLNAQTAIWNQDYTLDFNPGDKWKSLNVPGSPRQRTVTDSQIETQMEYMLMEPPTGGIWTGTNQFNITNLSQALQFRRDELLQMSGANPVNIYTPSPVLSQRTILVDSTIDVRRVRWLPVTADSSIAPYALWREDVQSADAFGDYLAIQPGAPDSWLITANSPLQFDVSCPPNVPGTWDMIVLWAGTALSPPSGTVLGLPDDWCWVAMYGALADALSNSPEARDDTRAKYCLMRYERGMKAMMTLPWMVQATVAKLPVDTPSYKEMDAFAQNWENTWPIDDPNIVVGGMDLVAAAPFATLASGTVSSVLTLVGNAPVNPSQPVQLGRDAVEQVLNYAQHLAMFKTGGADFIATIPLFKQFEDYCGAQNRRYAALGIFRPEMLDQGDRAEQIDPRFGPPEKGGKAK